MARHRGERHVNVYRDKIERIIGRIHKDDTHLEFCRSVQEEFTAYREAVGKNSNNGKLELAATITDWTGQNFWDDIDGDFTKLYLGGPTRIKKCWAILYCLRFLDEPERVGPPDEGSRSLKAAEAIETNLLRPHRPGRETYRKNNANKHPPHPKQPHRDELALKTPARLPPRFFTFEQEESYQPNRPEFEKVKAVLRDRGAKSVALVAAVTGPGGYGKTAIAEEIAMDADIREAFPGGVYWLQHGLRFGQQDERVGGEISTNEAISEMLTRQFADVDLRGFNLSTPALLFKALPDEPFLIIADDLWKRSQVAFLDHVPTHASVLFSTRSSEIARRASVEQTVGAVSRIGWRVSATTWRSAVPAVRSRTYPGA